MYTVANYVFSLIPDNKCNCTYQMSTRGIFVITGTKDECEHRQDELDDSDEQDFDEEKKIEDVNELSDVSNAPNMREVFDEEKD